MSTYQKLISKFKEKKHICVGLDPDLEKLPRHLNGDIVEFCNTIVEHTAEQAAAYKINLAFFECFGAEGFESLKIVVNHIKKIDADIPIIGDAKRGDIGNTSKKYAEALFNYFNFDSITLSPYMGRDSLDPFFAFNDKLNFVLALTSNKGSNDFEQLETTTGEKVYEVVIRKLKSWYPPEKVGIVFGATNLNELINKIHEIKDIPVLIPGVGAQGGELTDVARVFYNANSSNFLVNLSRGILYLDNSIEFGKAAGAEIKNMNKIVEKIYLEKS